MQPAPVTVIPIRQELSLVAHPSELWKARAFADEAGAAFGLDEYERYAVAFAVNEAASNAVEHGGSSPEGTIRLSADEEPDALVFYVEDFGWFTPASAAPDAPSDRGRGLALIAALVDEVDLRAGNGSTIVRLCKWRDRH